jgi:hypothetical protein
MNKFSLGRSGYSQYYQYYSQYYYYGDGKRTGKSNGNGRGTNGNGNGAKSGMIKQPASETPNGSKLN